MTPAVVAHQLSRRFGSDQAIRNVSIEVPKGGILAIVGPDGAGKTTLLRLLCAAIAPDAGSIEIDGVDAIARPYAVQARIGYMPARFSLYPDLSVDENLQFYGDLFGVPRREFAEHSGDLLRTFGLEQFRSRAAGFLSGGMKQKLALASVLVHRPQTLLLDEPTAGVDPVSRRAFWRILYALNKSGTTIVVTTAYLDEAERGNEIALLANGSIAASGGAAELKNRVAQNVVEIVSADRPGVRRALGGLPQVRSLEVYGPVLHALVTTQSAAVPEIRDRLQRAGITDAVVRPIPPSLEDAFVATMLS